MTTQKVIDPLVEAMKTSGGDKSLDKEDKEVATAPMARKGSTGPPALSSSPA
jgi:hypothetical protein